MEMDVAFSTSATSVNITDWRSLNVSGRWERYVNFSIESENRKSSRNDNQNLFMHFINRYTSIELHVKRPKFKLTFQFNWYSTNVVDKYNNNNCSRNVTRNVTNLFCFLFIAIIYYIINTLTKLYYNNEIGLAFNRFNDLST